MNEAAEPTPVAIGRAERAAARSLRTCLVRGPVVVLPNSLATHGPTPPIGLAYLAAVLEDAGHQVQVVDGAGEAILRTEDFSSVAGTLRRVGLSPAQVVERIPPDTELIGITNMFLHEWPQVRELAQRARERCPEATIILGGETPTAFWEHIFEETTAVDAIVLGEGERTLLAVADALADGHGLSAMEGLVLAPSADGAVADGGLPVRMRRLAEVPRPAWHLIDLEGYWAHPYFGVDRGRSMPVLATRGCPYKCSFCSSPQMWTTRYVVRDPDDVADEIADHVDRHDVRNINFCDLTAITKRRWTLDFCDALEARGLDITWQLPVGTRAEALDEEVLRRLYETGCRNITYAPESGSEHMLQVYDKKVKLPHILESLGHAHRIGLKTHVNIILGHPAETRTDVLRSTQFLLKAAWAGCDDAAVILFCPYPGSADFDDLLAAGRLEVDERTCYTGLTRSSSEAVSFNDRFSATALRILQLAMLATFYAAAIALHPRRLVALVRSRFGGDETTYLDQMLRTRRQAKQERAQREERDAA